MLQCASIRSLDLFGEIGHSARVISNLGIEEGPDDSAHLLVARFRRFSVPSVQRIGSSDRGVKLFSDHGERCEIAVVHFLYRDEGSVGVSEGLHGCEVQWFISLRPLRSPQVEKHRAHFFWRMPTGMSEHRR